MYKKIRLLSQGLPRPWPANYQAMRPSDEVPSALPYYIKHFATYPRGEVVEEMRANRDVVNRCDE